MPFLGTNFFLGIAVVWFMSGTLLSGGNGVRIRNLKVPEAVENGSKRVVLDCDYILDDPSDAEGLVVKWFFNNHPSPVYQWIVNEKPQDLGVLKGKLNLEYRASEENAKMYRALQIIRPTTDLSGEYRCLVSSFKDEASFSKKMTIYVPGRGLQLTQEKLEDDIVKIRCSAQGVYPEPNMTVSSHDRRYSSRADVQTVVRDSLYDITATVTFNEREIETPTTFDCVLRIPEANFRLNGSTVYYPTLPRTTLPTTTTRRPIVRPWAPPRYFTDVKIFTSPDSNAGHWVSPQPVLCTTVIALLLSRL